MHKYYDIAPEIERKGVVRSLTWKQKPFKENESYFLLRITLNQKDEKSIRQFII